MLVRGALGRSVAHRAAKVVRGFHGTAAARMAEEDMGATHVRLTLASPARPIMVGENVALVNIPGMTGEYGVAADHAAVVSELKPGLVQVFKEDGGPAESFFVSGGIAATHPGSATDIAAAEAATLDELDASAAQTGLADARRKLEAAAEGSEEQAIAQIECDVFEGVCNALGVAA